MVKKKDTIEEGIVVSRRRVIKFGDGGAAVTISRKWLDIQRWLGREVDELGMVADSVVILCDPKDTEKAKQFLREWEAKLKSGETVEKKSSSY